VDEFRTCAEAILLIFKPPRNGDLQKLSARKPKGAAIAEVTLFRTGENYNEDVHAYYNGKGIYLRRLTENCPPSTWSSGL